MNEEEIFLLSEVAKISNSISLNHKTYLIPICETFGYGATISESSKLWIEKDPEGAFVVGPCNVMVVPCGCKKPHKCKWCCGCGWLTEHVKSLKDKNKKPKGE